MWQTLLEEGVKPKRDEAGNHALNDKLIEALQSYRVSCSLLPLVAKSSQSSSSTASPKKPKATNSGGKGSYNSVQKPWIKVKVARAEKKAR